MAIEKIKILWGRFGATSQKMGQIDQIGRIGSAVQLVAPKRLQGSYFFLVVLGADCSFYVKSIATYAPQFFWHNNSVLAIVVWVKRFSPYKLNKVRGKFSRNAIGDFSQTNYHQPLGLPPTPISSVTQTKLPVVSKHLLYAAFLLAVARARRDGDVAAASRRAA